VQEEGSPTHEEERRAERKGRSAAEVCTNEVRKIGVPLAVRQGRSRSVLSTWFTDQTGDMAYTLSEIGWFRRFGLYAR